MEKLPARTGWLWVKEGFTLFRRQPAEISSLFLGYTLLMIGVGLIPVVGQIMPLVLLPVFAMCFMQACSDIERDQKVYPNLLLTGFRSPRFRELVKLGLLYPIAIIAAIGVSTLVDGGVLWKVMTSGQPLDQDTMRNSNLMSAMMVAGLVYIPAAMAFWYAAPLIAWQNMGVAKALFYSFFAVRRNGSAFLVYGLAWIGLGIFMPAIVASLFGALLGQAFVTMLILLTLSLVLTVILYCSFYPTYTQVFGRPGSDPIAPE